MPTKNAEEYYTWLQQIFKLVKVKVIRVKEKFSKLTSYFTIIKLNKLILGKYLQIVVTINKLRNRFILAHFE